MGCYSKCLRRLSENRLCAGGWLRLPFWQGDGGGFYQDKSTGKRYEGWYIATHFAETYSLGIHPGEDWNGSGGGNTDLGQNVFAVANGRTVFASNCGKLWGNVVVVEHLFLPE